MTNSYRARIAKTRPKNKGTFRERLKNIYASIEETKFNRYITHDIYQYRKYLNDGGVSLYSEDELASLESASISSRLPPRATSYYLDLASRSKAITNLIKARPEEMKDLSGERDPSNQLKYSPVPGLLHKYELILLYVARACSSWCRYCYRSDFLTGKTEKDIASITEIAEYITTYNARAAEHNTPDLPHENRMIPIREALLSGGDPMVLSNRNLFDYLHGLAEAGVTMIRIGTKELAFFPDRFDDHFFEMIDLFHELHPRVGLAFMVHFSHPDELLVRDKNTHEYINLDDGRHQRIEKVEQAIIRLRGRHYVTLENQAPIIDSVNDDPAALNLLQRELKRLGVNNHYYFQCREIEGHRAFAVPVQKAWEIHRQSQMGLSGIEKSRFAMSTEAGKMEVISVISPLQSKQLLQGLSPALANMLKAFLGDGLIVMKLHRVPKSSQQNALVVARGNPEALWITGYEDRILYDGRIEGEHAFAPLIAQLVNQLEATGGDAATISMPHALEEVV